MTKLNDWLDRCCDSEDLIDPIRVRRLALTMAHLSLSDDIPLSPGSVLPPLWHWAFFQPEIKSTALGPDGHPAVGGFMPPTDGLQRMWAGGRFRFFHPLLIGAVAQCHSRITQISEKQGQGGRLVFVTIEHRYTQANRLAFIEEQDVVYRSPSAPKLTGPMPTQAPQWQHAIQPDSTLLFRYSAVTFNGHRIHYDHPYATLVEGYADLVVHGPMMAAWALQAFIKAHPDLTVTSYQYRGLRPTTLPHALTVAGCLGDLGQADVWLSNDAGLIQQGTLTYLEPHTLKTPQS